jgi:hypothetical protein
MLHVLGDILLVTSADESRRQIVVCPPVYAAGLAVSPCGVTSADERRRQIVVCPPFYAAGLAISPCGAVVRLSFRGPPYRRLTRASWSYRYRVPYQQLGCWRTGSKVLTLTYLLLTSLMTTWTGRKARRQPNRTHLDPRRRSNKESNC